MDECNAVPTFCEQDVTSFPEMKSVANITHPDFAVLVLCIYTQVNMMFVISVTLSVYPHRASSNRPDRVVPLAEHCMGFSIPKVVGSIPTVAMQDYFKLARCGY